MSAASPREDDANTPPARGDERTLVLGIETSCDESAASVVRVDRRAWHDAHGECAHHARPDEILSNVVASQHDLHSEYGGVVPEIASRAHAERLLPVIELALHDAGVQRRDIGAIAVGDRPGLIGSLLVGVSSAKALAWCLGVPIVGVDHVEAHVYSGLIGAAEDDGCRMLRDVWPAIGLVVSGGHTAIYRCTGATSIRRIGTTIDDAVGEAYDKVAAMLGLGYPGGPEVDRLAREGDARAFEFPIARLDRGSLDFSFSGLKTSVLYALQRLAGNGSAPSHGISAGGMAIGAGLDAATKAHVCASFQRAAVRAVSMKVERAIEQQRDDDADVDDDTRVRTLLVGGGVSANSALRAELRSLGDRLGVRVVMPAMALCVDNAAMIAGLGGRVLASSGWRGNAELVRASPASRREDERGRGARGALS